MKLKFENKAIRGVLSVLPENTSYMEDEIINPDDPKAKRLKRIIGYGARRRAKGTTTLSDLLKYGMDYLIDNGLLIKDDIGAIIVSTLSQDYIVPTVSSILQGDLGIPRDVFCVDIPQACSGFTVGLIEAFMLLEHLDKGKKVVLCTGEILNRKSDENEPRKEHPSFGGDIANITIVENTDMENSIFCSYYNDGSSRDALVIRNGGFRRPMTPELIAAQTSNLPCTKMDMDGSAVFNFVQKEIPASVDEILKLAAVDREKVDYYLFHQPNRYMLEKLAQTMGIPMEKLPMQLTQELGNSNSGTIPAVITTYVADKLMEKDVKKCCLSGFGAGLTWATIVMDIGQLDFCENLQSNL